ncbi:hypothetical protein BMS3Abin17_00340 [archaeon BMS3Abin17]|nr:hypothetical protein BMS3Abin17_00340 [archaeon BMS3Abin17]
MLRNYDLDFIELEHITSAGESFFLEEVKKMKKGTFTSDRKILIGKKNNRNNHRVLILINLFTSDIKFSLYKLNSLLEMINLIR